MDKVFDEINLEKYIKSRFSLPIEIKSMIADDLPVGASASAKVFLSDKGMLFALISGQQGLNLGDVKKIISRMSLRAEQFMPPAANPSYFNDIAKAKLSEIFPGKKVLKDEDLVFYRTLAPYNPALVQIAEVIGGVIKQYDRDAASGWRPSVKFAYRRIRTS